MASLLRPAIGLIGVSGLLLLAGCATSVPGGTPTSTTLPDADGGRDADDFEGALLDDGRMFAVVTWGSSTCAPVVDTVSGVGQSVTVTLSDASAEDGEQACTKDMAPRASVGALPEGVDTSSEITIEVTYGDLSDQVDLDGGSYAGTPGTPTEYAPSAAWFEDGALVLLTWGSSSCPPEVESVEGSGAEGTVTFATDDEKVCTMDMAPRATIIDFGEDSVEDEGPFALTMVGGGLEGTVEVR